MSDRDSSPIPQFYRRSVEERLCILHDRQILDDKDFRALKLGRQTLLTQGADRMVENVIGVFGLPLGLGLNFRINGKPYIVPLVVEEPSIIAGMSSAAKLLGQAGGFEVESTDPILIGQVQLVYVESAARAKTALLEAKEEIINLANSLHPRLIARGGGVRDIEVIIHAGTSVGDMVVIHLLVDTRDAMGANLVNSMCEGVAPLAERITGGRAFLRILSNLNDRAMVTAEVGVPVGLLAGKGYAGEDVRDGIVLANEFARVDPYRAATHNKGIMNGVDAVALATGNDWRAMEAAAHAYAGRGNSYTALAQWRKGDSGDLIGRLEMPIKVGIVGGPMQSNPGVGLNLRILGVESATELAEVMGAVGLAQNFAALRALVTQGIQQGHMTLHARSVAMAAGAPQEAFDIVVERLVDSGEIKIWKAEEIVSSVVAELGLGALADAPEEDLGVGNGKVIILGEHAVVYGSHAIAAPVPLAIRASAEKTAKGVHLLIPAWGVEKKLEIGAKSKDSLQESLNLIFAELGITHESVRLKVFPGIPRAMGMGGSAAIAVAVIRALSKRFDIDLSDERVNEIAFGCEKIAHGTASGIDNTLATYGRFILFRKGEPAFQRALEIVHPIPIVLGITGVESLTAKMVARVRVGWQRNQAIYERIFNEIDTLTLQGVDAIEQGDLTQLGALMNINQGLLNALQVSSPELEELVQIARDNGALGAKLTGGGGGGSMVALCPDDPEKVAAAMQDAGYRAIVASIGGATE
ncbi:MAG: hydroxymethylglutaryl-CoA reductase [Deltaproteobacteria bacterium RIFOXYA12_FULL_58_15]|nr:MAG: hydroxymethylglutaryl-CoA reductase [Deltaproteobacteria bacterium RIFOXYA12_FULL_58_15]